MSKSIVRLSPEDVKGIVFGVENSVYSCTMCRKLVYPSIEILEDGNIAMDVDVAELRCGIGNSITVGNVCMECAKKTGRAKTQKTISGLCVRPQDAGKYISSTRDNRENPVEPNV